MPEGPTRVEPTTPVPPEGVPSPADGAVVLETPPAGPILGAPGVTWANANSGTIESTMAAARIPDVIRRGENFIKVSKLKSKNAVNNDSQGR